jgi:hypothetical protein
MHALDIIKAMKGIFQYKFSKILLVSLVILSISVFCLETVFAYQNQVPMEMQTHSYLGGDMPMTQQPVKNMMPCCGDNEHHDYSFDITGRENQIDHLVFLGKVIEPLDVQQKEKYTLWDTYKSLAPPGPDILASVIKKE